MEMLYWGLTYTLYVHVYVQVLEDNDQYYICTCIVLILLYLSLTYLPIFLELPQGGDIHVPSLWFELQCLRLHTLHTDGLENDRRTSELRHISERQVPLLELELEQVGIVYDAQHNEAKIEWNSNMVWTWYMQACGNIEPTDGNFDLFSSLLSCSPYTCNLYTAQFPFTGHSLHLSDNVLHDWLFPHHCMYMMWVSWYDKN